MSCQKERVSKLVEAAKSGKYKQAFEKLKDPETNDTFCILGLACEIYRLETGQGKWEDREFLTGVERAEVDDEWGGTLFIPESAEETLPKTVQDWYGFPDENPFDVMSLNDRDHLPLVKLAEIIQEGCKL